jgi:hypothetical protein
MNHTIIIHLDGTQTRQDWPKGRPKLPWLQEKVGGYIQEIPHWTQWEGERCIAYANEYGRLQKQPLNPEATKLWRKALDRLRPDYSPDAATLRGDVLIVVGTRYFRGG